MTALSEVQQRARNDAQNNLPLDNTEVRDWGARVASAYSSDPRERSMLADAYYNAFLYSLRSLTAERGVRTGNAPVIDRLGQRWG